MSFYLSAILLGLALGSMGFGIFISLRIFNIPDITTDGSYTLGAAITASLLSKQISLVEIIPIVIISGGLAGMATGIIHTKLKINALLAGILVMTSLYSINLSIMGRSNIPLIGTANVQQVFSFIQNEGIRWLLLFLAFMMVLLGILTWLLKTDFGIAMRATGNGELMARAAGVNTNSMKIIGLAIANSLTAFSGFLICQYQEFSDISMGIGIVIFGLGAVMIGESILNALKIEPLIFHLLGVLAGCIIFRIIIAFALSIGIDPNWLKLVTASIVLLFVGIPNLKRS